MLRDAAGPKPIIGSVAQHTPGNTLNGTTITGRGGVNDDKDISISAWVACGGEGKD